MKEWKTPAIACLDISDTAWESIDGTVPDGMKDDCLYLYS